MKHDLFKFCCLDFDEHMCLCIPTTDRSVTDAFLKVTLSLAKAHVLINQIEGGVICNAVHKRRWDVDSQQPYDAEGVNMPYCLNGRLSNLFYSGVFRTTQSAL